MTADSRTAAAFRRLASRFGPDLARWPEGAAAAARRRSAASPETAAALRAALAEAAALERDLSALGAAPAALPESLRARLDADAAMALAPSGGTPRPAAPVRTGRAARRQGGRWRLGLPGPAPAALAASAAIGLLLGYAGPEALTRPLAGPLGAAPVDSAWFALEVLPEMPDAALLEAPE